MHCDEVLRWWELFVPPEGKIPFWVHQDDVFQHRGASVKAYVRSLNRGWISYFYVGQDRRQDVFEISSWKDFSEAWSPVQAPSVWDHLLNDEAPSDF